MGNGGAYKTSGGGGEAEEKRGDVAASFLTITVQSFSCQGNNTVEGFDESPQPGQPHKSWYGTQRLKV